MNAPNTPFWLWTDIDGNGKRWHLCYVAGSGAEGDEQMIHYPLEDFEDFWYDDDWSRSDIRLIKPPMPKEE